MDFPKIPQATEPFLLGTVAGAIVLFVYQTVTVDQNGALEFRPDFYQRDDAVWQHLRRQPQPGIAQGDMAAQRRG